MIIIIIISNTAVKENEEKSVNKYQDPERETK